MTVLQLNPQANENAEAALARARQRPPGPVLIAGGGIGGLATALALARHGIASHVLERRPAFHEDGAGIQIGPNGTRILRRLGVADALRPLVGVPEALRVRDGRSGAELARLPLGRWIAMRHGAPYWVAHRKDLHSALLHASRAEPLIALSMGFDASEVASDAGHVAVAAENGQAWSGKALIAADGIWSPLRKLLFGGPAPKFCCKSAVRSVIPLDELPADFHRPETTIWLFRNAHVVHYPVSGGAELAVVVVLDDRHDTGDWSAPVPPSWVQQNMPPCAEPLQALILAGACLETVGAAHAARAAPMDAGSNRAARRCGAPRASFPGAGRRHGAGGCDGGGRRDAPFHRRCCRVQVVSAAATAARHARCPCLAPQRSHISLVGTAGGGAQFGAA